MMMRKVADDDEGRCRGCRRVPSPLVGEADSAEGRAWGGGGGRGRGPSLRGVAGHGAPAADKELNLCQPQGRDRHREPYARRPPPRSAFGRGGPPRKEEEGAVGA